MVHTLGTSTSIQRMDTDSDWSGRGWNGTELHGSNAILCIRPLFGVMCESPIVAQLLGEMTSSPIFYAPNCVRKLRTNASKQNGVLIS